MRDYKKIKDLLHEYNEVDVVKYVRYIKSLDGDSKASFMRDHKDIEIAEFFRQVAREGLVFDGKHITLQKRGISFDYVAYKNKLLLAYPEATMDFGVVYNDDTFTYSKEDGKVTYKHVSGNPFRNNYNDIIGVFCFIKTKRGEFMTMLDREEIDKCRKKALFDSIWRDWFIDMAYKTAIKKACKVHFDDVFITIEEEDNKQYNLENPVDIELTYKQEIDNLETLEEMKEYYEKNKGKGTAFEKYFRIKQLSLTTTQ